MLKVVIAEDSRLERMILRKMLSRIPNLVVEGEAESGEELITLAEKTQPHIVFLDIDMPRMSGLEAAPEIADINPQIFIIFATAHEHYAKQAFDVYAFDYLVKPYDFERIQHTIDRIKSFLSQNTVLDSPEDSLQDSEDEPLDVNRQHLLIPSDENLLLVKIPEILLITRSERKTEIHTLTGTYKTNRPLEKLEAKLGNKFFRCHKGYIINVDMVLGFTPWGNKTYLVTLQHTKESALITIEKLKQFRETYCL